MDDEATRLHGGRLIARRLKAHGVTRLFTLSGGHLFSLYEGCKDEGIDIVDTRHEATAAFAAEGWAKVTRQPGVAALTAGPGVTNGMSAMASAKQNHSPMIVLGGRAPAFRWGQGSLQEIDHVPFVRPIVKLAATAGATPEIPGLVDEAFAVAGRPYSGPVFLDFPLDVVFMEAEAEEAREVQAPRAEQADGDAIERALALLGEAERPVVMAGTDLYWGRGEDALRELVERRGIPVFLNGLGRGCLPADHELAFARARKTALGEADVALVIGVPMDFRLGFGKAFSEDAEVVVIDVAEPEREHPRPVAAELYGDLTTSLRGLLGDGPSTKGWVAKLREEETAKREAEREQLSDPRGPLHPMRVYGELAQVLDRNAIVIGDGGDFVSFAGRVVDSYEPGCWLDPGPFGCLGSGPGYALAAKLAHPGPPGRAAARRRRVRLQRHGVRHARPPRRERRRRDGQQRHLGAREAPDGVPLQRLVGGRGPAAGDALRHRRGGARRARRVRDRGGRPAARAGPRVLGGQAGARERVDRSRRCRTRAARTSLESLKRSRPRRGRAASKWPRQDGQGYVP